MQATIEANKTISTAETVAAMTDAESAAEASIVYGRYASQAALYKTVKSERSLSSEGILRIQRPPVDDNPFNHIRPGLVSTVTFPTLYIAV